LSYSVKNPLVAFKTLLALPVFDYGDNYIFNVDGQQLSHNKFRDIARGLKKINISFVFEGGEQTIAQFPQIVNALQNLQPLFENSDDYYSYHFNWVMTFDETGKLLRPADSGFTADYTQIINKLSDKANMQDKLSPIRVPRTSWPALRKSVELFDKHRDATNLIVLIGDKKPVSTGIDSAFVNRMLRNNCRIIGFQVYGGEGDDYNDFVLDIEDMISSYAEGMIKAKRSVLVSPGQIRRRNSYVQAGEHKNSYRLDFPENSITQGALFFPQKNESLPMEILTNNIDTLLWQIRQDNSDIALHMSKAFAWAGNNRTRFDSLFVRNFGIDTSRIPQRELVKRFVNEIPGWYLPSKIIVLNDSQNAVADYRLMLSKDEKKELKEFIAALSQKEVDFILEQKKKAEQRRKPCNCPNDDLFAELEKEKAVALAYDTTTAKELPHNDVSASGSYADTRKIRNHLSETLLRPVKYSKPCKEPASKLKELTLAEAQYRITGCPTSHEMLNAIRIRDLKDKKIVTDEMLDELISYYKEMKKELDKAEAFESNGQTYYWVDRKLLP
jgi:hypothetical protein